LLRRHGYLEKTFAYFRHVRLLSHTKANQHINQIVNSVLFYAGSSNKFTLGKLNVKKCDLNPKLIYQSKILKRNLVENCNKQQKKTIKKLLKRIKKGQVKSQNTIKTHD